MVVVLASQLGDLSELGGFGVDSESLSLALLLRRSSKASWLLGSMAIAPRPLRSSSCLVLESGGSGDDSGLDWWSKMLSLSSSSKEVFCDDDLGVVSFVPSSPPS